MEPGELIKPTLSCFKCYPRFMGPLNIDYNTSGSAFILWNKYEIFLYENFVCESASRIFLPEFQIYHLISSNNLIVCLDYSGNIHITSMKFKHASHKRLKTNFLPREQNVLVFTLSTYEKLLCLKLEQEAYYLCFHNLNTEFKLEKKIKVSFTSEYNQQYSSNPNAYILKCYKLTEQCENLIKIFDMNKDVWKDNFLILISFDRRVLYGCIVSPKSQDQISLQKLHTALTEICDIKISYANHISILIILKEGTLIRLALNDNKTTDVVHLNTAIYKCTYSNNAFIYTDGIKMWKCEDAFAADIKLQLFLVEQIKDFVCFGDQLLCTTNNNLIYLFGIDEDLSYVPSSSNEYCDVGNVLNDTGYLSKVLEQCEVNDKLEDKISDEIYYMTALSIANHSDLLDSVLGYSCLVCEGYEDIMNENLEITLTNNYEEYFSPYLFYLLMKITVIFENYKVRETILNVLKDLKIHITLLSGHKVMKTTSIQIFDELKNINLLLPLNGEIVDSSINVKIKIDKRIPGGLNKEQVLWINLHSKDINLNSEHFIKSKTGKHNIIQLKKPENSIEDALYQLAYNSNKIIFTFTNIANRIQLDEFSFYVKLPTNFEAAFKSESFFKKIYNNNKTMVMLQKHSSEDFLKNLNNIIFEIGNAKVKVQIINDGITNTLLKITCDNMKIGFDIRNFYSNLAYNNFIKGEPGKEFIRYTMYATIENLQISIRECIINNKVEDLKTVLEHFHFDVYGALPL
ncbi:uncharacterized protein [Battus philenor]|uniref:uncharacterized protein n=1 Tax=Battus philenor TaxID=42288 RepID=UPI0035CF70A5